MKEYYALDRFEVYCAWGMAEDVIIFSNSHPNVSLGMNIAQAEKLIVDLQTATEKAKELQSSIVEYEEREKENVALLVDLLNINLLERALG